MNLATTPQQREYSTNKCANRLESRRLVIPIRYEEYEKEMSTPEQAIACIDKYHSKHPELFPPAMKDGFKLNGWTEPSKKMPDKRLRRIRLSEENDEGKRLAYTIAPCDLLPYMSGTTDEVEKAIFLKQFGVPDWGLTHLFGRNDSYWYRLGASFGRCNLVGATVKDKEKIPQDILADEKHAKAHGEKWYIGTTVAQDCILGVSISTTADAKGLTEVYGQFKEEAQQILPDYMPKTVNTDGWAATGKAWKTLFPSVTVILCFLHAFIKIRSRCKRLETFEQIKQQVWDIYHAVNRVDFNQGVDQLKQWVMAHRATLTKPALDAIDKLCQRADQYGLAYDHPTAYRTSNMLDRHMEPMARWLDGGRYFHGNIHAAELRTRGWALIHNYRLYCPRAKVREIFFSPAHKFNGFVYRENWLENLLVSSSCQWFRYSHKKR